MTVFESLMLAVAFASLILALTDNQKNNPPLS
ncbi:putative holin-like toxin [Oceanobacillus jeddahense]|nr:putative holin-like toxin [Oceanobacillus jeddahense]